MGRTASDGATTAGESTAGESTARASAAGARSDESGPNRSDATPTEYERLRAKKKERQGNAERAEVRDVFVGERRVVLTLGFDWTTDTRRLAYDLDDDRDVLKLEALAESKGFDFEQVSFLEGETLAVVYTGREWVPEANVAHVEGEGSAWETFRTELRLLAREIARSPKALRRLVRASRTMSTKQVVIAVIIVKKLIVVALLAWLLL